MNTLTQRTRTTGKLLIVGGLAFATALSFSGCYGGQTNAHEHGSEGHGHENAHQPGTASHSATGITHYITIQERLAADSMDGVGDHAEKLAARLSEIGDAKAVEAARAMAKTADIAEARRQFETVSVSLLAHLKEHGSGEGDFYAVHCPMAFRNRGASWIQADTTVKNPYYGSRMLGCGAIRETFASATGHDHSQHHHDRDTAPVIEELPAGARTIEIQGTEFAFEPALIEVEPGEVFALKLINAGNVVHMWQLEGRPETHVHAEVGQTAVGVITAPGKPGEYRTVCTEAGHTEAGMAGKLIVVAKQAPERAHASHEGHSH